MGDSPVVEGPLGTKDATLQSEPGLARPCPPHAEANDVPSAMSSLDHRVRQLEAMFEKLNLDVLQLVTISDAGNSSLQPLRPDFDAAVRPCWEVVSEAAKNMRSNMEALLQELRREAFKELESLSHETFSRALLFEAPSSDFYDVPVPLEHTLESTSRPMKQEVAAEVGVAAGACIEAAAAAAGAAIASAIDSIATSAAAAVRVPADDHWAWTGAAGIQHDTSHSGQAAHVVRLPTFDGHGVVDTQPVVRHRPLHETAPRFGSSQWSSVPSPERTRGAPAMQTPSPPPPPPPPPPHLLWSTLSK